jgi:hypothetical protein
MGHTQPAIAAALVLLAGCSPGGKPTTTGLTDTGTDITSGWDGILSSIGTTIVMPRFEATLTAADALAAQANTFCQAPDADGLDATRTAWSAVMAHWKHGESGQFGPVWMEPWRVGPKVDTWPARPASIQGILDDDFDLTFEVVSTLGTVHRGLPVLDWLLFVDGTESLAAFTDPTTGSRRCDYLVAVTADTANQFMVLRDTWSPSGTNWLANYTAPGPSTDLMSTRASMDEVVNRTIFAVENVRLLKLGKPAGQSSGGTPQLDLIESPQSGRSLRNALDSLAGIEGVFLGAYEGSQGSGLIDAVADPERQATIRSAFDTHYAASVSAIEAVPPPLTEAIYTHSVELDAATTAIRDLQVVLQVDLAQALAVTIRFNDTDGD